MSKINESGEVQYEKVTLRMTIQDHIKAIILLYRNWDAERWYRKYGG